MHRAIWKSTREKVAVKVQNPDAERLMTGDLKNLVVLAEFLQRTELKFDILSALKELQKQIKNEFDFVREARNMDSARKQLRLLAPTVCVPRSLFRSKRALVMSFVEGDNLGKLQEFNASSSAMPSWLKKKAGLEILLKYYLFIMRYPVSTLALTHISFGVAGKRLLLTLAQAWGAQFFEMRMFHADPHPGNICVDWKGLNGRGRGAVGLLDWGQVKFVSDKLALDFAHMVEAINSQQQARIVDCLHRLGN